MLQVKVWTHDPVALKLQHVISVHLRMLLVFSWTTSVLSRLSASTKAPCSTVSSSMVAARSCSPADSALQAECAWGCSRLFTVSTIA